MKTFTKIIYSTMSACVLCGTTAIADVTLYEHCNYQGNAITLSNGEYNYSALGNDTVSSIKVDEGSSVILYQDYGFTGEALPIYEDTACLVDVSFNDKMSSLEIGRTDDLADLIRALLSGQTSAQEKQIADLLAKIQRTNEQILVVQNLIEEARSTHQSDETIKELMDTSDALRESSQLYSIALQEALTRHNQQLEMLTTFARKYSETLRDIISKIQ